MDTTSLAASVATSLERIRADIPEYARDLKLNLGSVLTTAGAPGLSDRQIWSVALSSAIASRNRAFTRALEALRRKYSMARICRQRVPRPRSWA